MIKIYLNILNYSPFSGLHVGYTKLYWVYEELENQKCDCIYHKAFQRSKSIKGTGLLDFTLPDIEVLYIYSLCAKHNHIPYHERI